MDADGIRDPDELGLQDWTIRLEGMGMARTTTTDSNGEYIFVDVFPGTYIVSEVLQTGWMQTSPTGDGTHSISLASGQILTGIDFANVQLGEIHGSKWHDLNADGVFNSDQYSPYEWGLGGWTIYLDDNNNGVLDGNEQFTTTGNKGEYSFTDLLPGTYTVAEVQQSGWRQTSPAGDGTHTVTLTAGEIANDIDFGNQELAAISGWKFHDLNSNGMYDPDEGESPLQGWTIFLDEDNDGILDPPEQSTTTDADGYYEFVDLIPGTYTVAEVLQAGWERTYPGIDGIGDLLQTFENPNPGVYYYDKFGYSLAAFGDDVLVGSPGIEDPSEVHLFDGETGQLLQTFVNPDPFGWDGFGYSLAAFGNSILIGTTRGGTNYSGVVYMFDATTAQLVQTFENPTPVGEDYFGAAIVVIGDKILITAPYDDTGDTDAGIAYLFNGTTGELLQTFQAPTPKVGEYFGTSAAALGNNILIGSPGIGAAYQFDSITGDLLQTYLDPFLNDYGFGWAVAATGDDVLISSAGGQGVQEGVYLFDGATGQLLRTFAYPTQESFSYFGVSIAAIGERIFIGYFLPYYRHAGVVYVFDRMTGNLEQTLYGPQGSPYDGFGGVMAPIGSNLLIGTTASGWDGYYRTWPQAVYLFEPASGLIPQTVTVGPGQTLYDIDFGNSVAIPPAVVTVALNNDVDADRTVSSIEPSGIGVRTIEITFSEAINFTNSDVLLQAVTFPGGTETIGDMLTPLGITGSGTDTMTISFENASVVNTWVKVTLNGSGTITDLFGYALDGEAAPGGSGRGYIYDVALDLPTGDGTAGGDAIFYVGSLRGDLFGGTIVDPEPNGRITPLDKNGFVAAYNAGDLDADFFGPNIASPDPEGAITPLDKNGFVAAYNRGAELDELPTSLSGAVAGMAMITMPISDQEQQAAVVTNPTDTAFAETQDEPVISAVSFLFFHRSNKPRSVRKANIQLQPVNEIAIPMVKTTLTPETLELPETSTGKDFDETDGFLMTIQVPINYRGARKKVLEDEDDPFDLLGLPQLELLLGV